MVGESEEDKKAKRVDELIEELNGLNQLKALDELGFYSGEKVKDALIQSLNSKKASMRMQAAETISLYHAKTNDDRVLEPLIQAMTDPVIDVRGYVVGALGRIGLEGDTRVISPLNQALRDQDPRVRKLAKMALENIKVGEDAKSDRGVVAREPRTSGPAVKTKKKGCGRLLMLTCGVISLLFAGFSFFVGLTATGLIATQSTTQGFDGDTLIGAMCIGLFSLAPGVLLIIGYRRLGKESGAEKQSEKTKPVTSVEQVQLLQSLQEVKVLNKQSAILGVCSELTALRMKILGFSKQYPLPINKGGPGVAKAEKQIPWIDRTLKEAAEALTAGKDPFDNPITITQTKSGLEQLISMVCDEEYLTFMELIYDGIADPLKKSMQELKQIIERIPLT